MQMQSANYPPLLLDAWLVNVIHTANSTAARRIDSVTAVRTSRGRQFSGHGLCSKHMHSRPRLWLVKVKGTRVEQGAEAVLSCDFDAEDYEAVKQHMQDGWNPGVSQPAPAPKRPRTATGAKASTKEPPTETPEEAKQRLAKDSRTKSVGTPKVTHDRLAREVDAVQLIDVRLKQKAWNTEGPRAYLKARTGLVCARLVFWM